MKRVWIKPLRRVCRLFLLGACLTSQAPLVATGQTLGTNSDEVSCRPKDRDGKLLPFLTTDATLKCEMFLFWQQDCRSSSQSDQTGAYHQGYCPRPPASR